MHSLIPTRWQVPNIFRERLGEKVGRQRLMTAEGHLLMVLHKPPVPGEEERHARLFWRNPAGEWQCTEPGNGLGELHEHLAEFDTAAERLEAQMRGTPSAMTYYQILQESTPMVRAVHHMAAVLQQAREAQSSDRNILLARDESVEIERHLELLHAEAMHGLQFLVARRSEEQAEQGERLVASSHRLNLLMALCLPMTALASVLGMNIRHGLEGGALWIFWAVIGLSIFLGLLVLVMVAAPVKPAKPVALPKAGQKKR